MNDFCTKCGGMVPVVTRHTADGIAYICAVCGRQTDFSWDDDDRWDCPYSYPDDTECQRS